MLLLNNKVINLYANNWRNKMPCSESPTESIDRKEFENKQRMYYLESAANLLCLLCKKTDLQTLSEISLKDKESIKFNNKLRLIEWYTHHLKKDYTEKKSKETKKEYERLLSILPDDARAFYDKCFDL